MKNKESQKTAKPAADEKAGIAKIVDEILSGCSTVPDTTLLFSKIRELERSAIDYASIVSKRFGKSTIAEQAFMINHLFPHLKKFSLSESLNSVVQKESFAPQILVDMLHYLIRSDTIIDSNLLQSANEAEELSNQLSKLLEDSKALQTQEGAKLLTSFAALKPSFQMGIIMELIDHKKDKVLPLLARLMQDKSAIAPRVIDYLSARAEKTEVHLLQCLLKETRDKELSKSIKKTLYRLKNKGIEVELHEPAAPPPPQKKRIPLPSPSAYATTIDPLGERLIVAVKPKTEQELLILQFLLNDHKGINDLIASTAAQKDFNAYLTKIKSTKQISMVEIDLDYCHFLIKESSRKNHTSGTRIPESFFLWKKMFGRPDRELEQAAIYALLSADEIRSQEFLLNQSPSLIEKYEAAFWLLEWKLLVDCYKEVYEVENSLLVLAEPQKKERMNEIVQKTARQFFDEGNRLLFQRRLEEIAFIFWESGQKEDAKVAFAAALAFSPEGVPSDKHPFALQTVTKNFSFLKEQSQKEKRSDSGRIILP